MAMRGETEVDVSVPTKALEQYERVYGQNTEFFSSFNPDLIEESFLGYLKTLSPEQFNEDDLKINKDKYKIKFTVVNKGKEELIERTQICMRILRVDETNYCIEFSKLGGTLSSFHKQV